MGSKNRIAKHILPIMLAERKPNQWWVEPFVGGANMIDKVGGNRIGADNNKLVLHIKFIDICRYEFSPLLIAWHFHNPIHCVNK